LVGVGGGPNGAVASLLDVVLIRTFDYVEPAVLQHGCEVLLRNYLMEAERLINIVLYSYLYAHT
jgi:hypothetical protein